MRRKLCSAYLAAGVACIAYYLLFSTAVRFGLNLGWMWPVVGAVLVMAGIVGQRDNLPRWVRLAWRIMLCVGLALVFALESLVISGMVQKAPAGLDYLVILGARVNDNGPSPALQWRIDAAVEYLQENPETIAIASGGQGQDEPMSEAECIRRGLIAAGIAEERILLEDRSTTTAENMQFSRALIAEGESTAGIVTNNFHVYRALRLAKKAGLGDIHGLAAGYGGVSLLHYMMREGVCLIADKLMGNL